MQEKSVPDRVVRDSTRALRATPQNIEDACRFLFLDGDQAETFRRCLSGEPLKRLLGLVDWLASHERDDDYRPSAMVEMWAKKRQAGCYRPSRGERVIHGEADPDPNGEVERSLERPLSRGSWGRFLDEQVEANLARMEAGS